MENNFERFEVSFGASGMTHLDFGGRKAGAAVHPLESDGVELPLVQVDHGQLTGLVMSS